MDKVKKLSFLFVFALIFSLSFSCLSCAAETYYYATTDMTWAEFYAAEVEGTIEALEAAGLDAYTNPTTRMAASFPVYYNTAENATEYYGIKAVRVRMTEAVYNALTDKSRYTFVDEAFTTDYKDVNADGTFDKMVTETTTPESEVTLTSGSSTPWGNYLLAASNVDIATAKYLGAVITTSDGAKYGLRHANNLWRNSQIALTYEEGFTEAHGYPREYAYTSDLEGKAITGITYMRLDSEDIVLTGLNLYLKTNPSASVNIAGNYVAAGTNPTVKFEFTNAPDDADYSVSTFSKGEWVENLRHGQPGWRWNALTADIDYTYSQEDQTITISGDVESGDYYQAVFTSEKYVDINTYFYAYSVKYATTNMTFAEFYAGEIGSSADELKTAGLDAFSNPTVSVANPEDARHYIPVLWADRDTDEGKTTFYGVKDIPVRMTDDVYNALSDTDKERFTLSDSAFDEFKEVSSDMSFGKMVSEVTENDSTITLQSGSSARWGNYVLVPSNVTVDPTKYIGATLTTSDGKTYGLRHDSSIWRNNNVALTYDADFREAHGYPRAYEYTSDVAGKIVKNITYMFLGEADISVSCDVYLKPASTATVAPVYDEGMNAFMVGTSEITITNLPEGYTLSGVSFGTGRNAVAVEGCTYEDGILTIPDTSKEGTYTATFTSDTYGDIAVKIEFFTVLATSLLVEDDNNAAGLSFMLTPQGVSDTVDATLEGNKFVNATACVIKSDNTTALYDAEKAVDGSGFTFNIALSDDQISDDYKAIVGFSYPCVLTEDNLGTNEFNTFLTGVKRLPKAEGFYIIMGNQLKNLGLKVISVKPDGSLRDVTSYLGSGAMISESQTEITFVFGAMIADCDDGEIKEGRYTLSDEGEMLFADGASDNHLIATWYLEKVPVSNQGGNNSDNNQDSNQNNNSQNNNTDTNTRPENTGGNPPSGNVAPVTVREFSTPKLDLSSQEKKQDVIDALKGSITGLPDNVDVVPLNQGDSGVASVSPRESSALSDSDKSYLAEQNQQVAAVLPVVVITESKIYVFNVDLSSVGNLEAGAPLFWQSMEKDTNSASGFRASDNSKSEAVFFDSQGNKITTVPSDKAVDVAAYLEAGKTYEPLITTQAASSNSDNTDTDTNTNNEDNEVSGSGGGGCNMFASAVLLSLLLLYKKNS